MKTIFSIFIIILLIGYLGCSTNLVSPNSSTTAESGQVVLKISSDSIPSSVVKITAILTQSGNDTLISSVKPLSGSSASLNFTNVSVGPWHLKVNAEAGNEAILYTGQTDLIVQSGITTQVNLNLVPVNNGTGNIVITVNWGNSINNWIDYSGNPVFYEVDSFSPFGVTSPKILVDDSVMKMWYRQQGASGHSTIGYAVSTDGINWTIPIDHPVLYTGTSGEWDSYAVTNGVVIKDGISYKMYYSGTNVHDGYAAIGLAYSTDGINWQKNSEPVLIPNETEVAIVPESILKISGKYYLYYCEGIYPNHRIRLAISNDGLNWVKYGNNPILYPTEEWEGSGVYYSSIIFENGIYKMVYMNINENGWAFGKAISLDGINWEKAGSNPFFSNSETIGHWANKIAYPFLIKFQGGYRVYYNNGYPSDGIYKIGFIQSPTF